MDKSFFQAGEMPRNQFQVNLKITGVQTDQWIDYLGPEIYCWWLKFHSWIDNSPTKKYKNHIPYTLESVMSEKHLNVSKSAFYRKIKKLWECGLIEIYEFEPSERKSQKPKNIFVYSYPFNKAELEYKPLEKLRDWAKDYDSESKIAGMKGPLIKKAKAKEKAVDNSPKTVDKPVDNSLVDNVDNVNKYPPKFGTVYPPRFGTVTLPDLGPNQLLNNLVNIINNHNQLLNNSLSQSKIDLIQELLKNYNFNAGERERIIELINNRGLFSISKVEMIKQADYMSKRTDIIDRPIFFVNGLEMNIKNDKPTWGKRSSTSGKHNTNNVRPKKLPFYNWLEDDKN
jgi:predicted transcriptional regulator